MRRRDFLSVAAGVYFGGGHAENGRPLALDAAAQSNIEGIGTGPTRSVEIVEQATGPFVSVSAARQLGPVFESYEAHFRTFGDIHWARQRTSVFGGGTANGEAGGQFYDRAKIWYVAWARSGDPEYLQRAELQVAAYLNYLEAQSYKVQTWWVLPDGLGLNYLLTRNPGSAAAIVRLAERQASQHNLQMIGDPSPSSDADNREQAITLSALLWANAISLERGPKDSIGARRAWAPILTEALERILSTQMADGAFRFASAGGAVKPFMLGMLLTALIQYHERFRPDSRIKDVVTKALDYVWDHCWDTSYQAFRYVEHPNRLDADTTPYPDLNLLLVHGFGWAFRMTGERKFVERGDYVWAGGVTLADLQNGKAFNQNYCNSYRYLPLRGRAPLARAPAVRGPNLITAEVAAWPEGAASVMGGVTDPNRGKSAYELTIAGPAGDRCYRRTGVGRHWNGGTQATFTVWIRAADVDAASEVYIATMNELSWNTGLDLVVAPNRTWQMFTLQGDLSAGPWCMVLIGNTDKSGRAGGPRCRGKFQVYLPHLSVP